MNSTQLQQLVQKLKKVTMPGLLLLGTMLVAQAQARDLSLSVQGQIQPGVYGQIQIGQGYQQPVYQQPIYAQPVYVQPVYPQQTVIVQPILVKAPKKHRKHWKKYCHHYGACQQRVQFVEVDYRPRNQHEKVYVYNVRDPERREESRHYHHDRH